jgi:hypothetical protein
VFDARVESWVFIGDTFCRLSFVEERGQNRVTGETAVCLGCAGIQKLLDAVLDEVPLHRLARDTARR